MTLANQRGGMRVWGPGCAPISGLSSEGADPKGSASGSAASRKASHPWLHLSELRPGPRELLSL